MNDHSKYIIIFTIRPISFFWDRDCYVLQIIPVYNSRKQNSIPRRRRGMQKFHVPDKITILNHCTLGRINQAQGL